MLQACHTAKRRICTAGSIGKLSRLCPMTFTRCTHNHHAIACLRAFIDQKAPKENQPRAQNKDARFSERESHQLARSLDQTSFPPAVAVLPVREWTPAEQWTRLQMLSVSQQLRLGLIRPPLLWVATTQCQAYCRQTTVLVMPLQPSRPVLLLHVEGHWGCIPLPHLTTPKPAIVCPQHPEL